MPTPKRPASAGSRHDRFRVRAIFGLLSAVPLPAIGAAFPLSSFFAVLLLPVKPLVAWPNQLKWLLGFAVVGTTALMLSSAVNQTTPSENVRYFAATALFLAATAHLVSHTTNAAEFLAMVSVGTILFYALFGTTYSQRGWDYLWKFGVAFPVIVVFLWLVAKLRHGQAFAWAVLTIAAFISLAAGFRSQAGLCLVVLLLLIAKSWNGKFRFVRVVVAGVLLIVGLNALNGSIEAGFFGRELQLKTSSQLEENGPGILAGRVEPPLSFAAIAAKPFLGWGNTNAINNQTVSEGVNIAYALGLRVKESFLRIWIRDDGRVSLHSILFDSWVSGGPLAALLPVALIAVFVGGIWFARGQWAALTVTVSVQQIWNILFSPWSQSQTVLLAAGAALAIWAVIEAKRKLPGSATAPLALWGDSNAAVATLEPRAGVARSSGTPSP